MVTGAVVPVVSAGRLASWAAQALRDEACLSPKPGLVDRRGSGAHRDMDLALLMRSADVLEPWFERLAEASMGRPLDDRLRTELGEVGRRAEADLLVGTEGVNTHRGALFALGLLVAAAAATGACRASEVAAAAGALARCRDAGAGTEPNSNGRRARLLMPGAGAPQQAQDGYPSVVHVALPMLVQRRAAGAGEDIARLDALLALMATLDDTCVIYRGGIAGLRQTKAGAAAVLAAGGSGTADGRAALTGLDRRLVAAGLSPGGSGDLLAATLLLDRIEEPRCRS
jgi:triphosphoribosyl-dephospho-CoA synthase